MESILKIIMKIIEVVRPTTKHVFCLFLVSAALLFCPDSLLRKVHLENFADKWASYIGFAFLVSFVWLFLVVGLTLWRAAGRTQRIQEKVWSLDPQEKAILREFFLGQRKNVIPFPLENPVVAGLLDSGVLRVVSRYWEPSIVGNLFPMAISKKAMRLLTNKLIGLPESPTPDDDVLDFLQNNRPEFIQKLERMRRFTE